MIPQFQMLPAFAAPEATTPTDQVGTGDFAAFFGDEAVPIPEDPTAALLAMMQQVILPVPPAGLPRMAPPPEVAPTEAVEGATMPVAAIPDLPETPSLPRTVAALPLASLPQAMVALESLPNKPAEGFPEAKTSVKAIPAQPASRTGQTLTAMKAAIAEPAPPPVPAMPTLTEPDPAPDLSESAPIQTQHKPVAEAALNQIPPIALPDLAEASSGPTSKVAQSQHIATSVPDQPPTVTAIERPKRLQSVEAPAPPRDAGPISTTATVPLPTVEAAIRAMILDQPAKKVEASTDTTVPDTTLAELSPLPAPIGLEALPAPDRIPTHNSSAPRHDLRPIPPEAVLPAVINHAVTGDTDPVEVVLNPQELGHLRFEIRHHGDQVNVVLTAERPDTLDLMRRHGEQLLTDLRQAGFSDASLSFGQWTRGEPHPDPQIPQLFDEPQDRPVPAPTTLLWPRRTDLGGQGLNLRL